MLLLLSERLNCVLSDDLIDHEWPIIVNWNTVRSLTEKYILFCMCYIVSQVHTCIQWSG